MEFEVRQRTIFRNVFLVEHVTRPKASSSLGNIDSQVSLDSFTLVLDPDESDENCDNAEEDVNMCDNNISLCDERSVFKLKRNKSCDSDHKCNSDISIKK